MEKAKMILPCQSLRRDHLIRSQPDASLPLDEISEGCSFAPAFSQLRLAIPNTSFYLQLQGLVWKRWVYKTTTHDAINLTFINLLRSLQCFSRLSRTLMGNHPVLAAKGSLGTQKGAKWYLFPPKRTENMFWKWQWSRLQVGRVGDDEISSDLE